MFLLCNGDNYRNNVTNESVSPGPWDLPASLDPLFTAHFKAMLQAFKEAKVKMIPSLIDFHFPAWEDRDVIITDSAKRSKFLNMVLDEFLAASKDFQETIFAWEVMNEPSWDTRAISPPLHRHLSSLVSEGDMTTFLQEALNKIEGAGFESTVGHRFIEDLDTLPTGTKRQFHYYWKRWHGFDILPDPVRFPGSQRPTRSSASSIPLRRSLASCGRNATERMWTFRIRFSSA